jgi:hypothetical protein
MDCLPLLHKPWQHLGQRQVGDGPGLIPRREFLVRLASERSAQKHRVRAELAFKHAHFMPSDMTKRPGLGRVIPRGGARHAFLPSVAAGRLGIERLSPQLRIIVVIPVSRTACTTLVSLKAAQLGWQHEPVIHHAHEARPEHGLAEPIDIYEPI